MSVEETLIIINFFRTRVALNVKRQKHRAGLLHNRGILSFSSGGVGIILDKMAAGSRYYDNQLKSRPVKLAAVGQPVKTKTENATTSVN